MSLSDKLRIAEANLTSTGYEYKINLEKSRNSDFQESISKFAFIFLAYKTYNQTILLDWASSGYVSSVKDQGTCG